MAEALFFTTQPGWAFATLAELRARGVQSYASFYHRDSTLALPAHPALLQEDLRTPADVLGLVLRAEATARRDATERFRRDLDPSLLKEHVLRWLPLARGRRPGRYSIDSELWGETALHRHALAGLVREVTRLAFPRWAEDPSGGVRLLCKADTQTALLGVRLYSNLSQETQGRHGALREHLACALLMLAHVRPGDAVLDPCMGTGTILRAAWQRFGVRTCIGAEIDRAAYRVARRNVQAPDARLSNRSFEELAVGGLPRATKLVSNLPFGVQFQQVRTDRVLTFLADVSPRVQGVALLMAREQAKQVGQALHFRTKNVLVLGQPAAIVHSLL